MLESLKKTVCDANLRLVSHGLVLFTWGNVSAIDKETRLVVIKPSGISYDNMKPEDMVVLDLDGHIVEGKWRPSSDTPTHLELYKACPQIGGIVHTHSTHATAFAQAGRSIPAYGTTHADYFYGDIPCARRLTQAEVENDYEKNTGLVMIETLAGRNPMEVPAMLTTSHGPFAWGKNAIDAVHNAAVLEEVARMAILTRQVNPTAAPAPQRIQDKHYMRKHGPNAYYGQGKK
jgi:L-ribulose-5-phosphate 4-epimerase